MDLLRQFNKYANDQRSLVQKAMLTAATGVGEALIPQHLEKIITSLIVRLTPEIAVITPRYDAQKYHEFNRLTSLPASGGAMGEGAVTPTNNSTYQRTGRNLKVIRRKGAVTNFLQDSSKNYIDAAAVEMENQVQAHIYDLVTYDSFGNDGADPYTPPGLDTLIATNRINKAVGGAPPTDLTDLDDLIDRNTERQGLAHRKCFVMSPQMLSKFSRLLTNVRLNQGLRGEGLSTVDIPGGWRLNAYRDVPIIQSTQCRPKVQMGTVSTATSATGGTIPDGTYYFVVAPITWGGEQLGSAEVSRTTAGGNASTLTLSWAAVSGAFYYKIYCSTTTNTEKLVVIIPWTTYDSTGTIVAPVTGCVFTTNPSSANPTLTLSATGGVLTGPTASVPTGMQNDLPLTGTLTNPPEYLFFWDLDEFQGMGKYAYTNTAGSRFNGLVTLEPLAKTDDNLPFLIKTYGSLIDSWEATSAIIRGLKVAA
jgi:hypothetical protein